MLQTQSTSKMHFQYNMHFLNYIPTYAYIFVREKNYTIFFSFLFYQSSYIKVRSFGLANLLLILFWSFNSIEIALQAQFFLEFCQGFLQRFFFKSIIAK